MRWDTGWHARAQQLAAKAVASAPEGAADEAAKASVRPLIAEYEHEEAIQNAIGWVFLGTEQCLCPSRAYFDPLHRIAQP
jgi:hypothetical protein